MQAKAKAPRARKAAPAAIVADAPAAATVAATGTAVAIIPATDTPATTNPAVAAISAKLTALDKAALREATNIARADAVATAYATFRNIDAGRASVPVKALAAFKSAYKLDIGATTHTANATVRQAAFLATLAIAAGIKLSDGCDIPRRVTLRDASGRVVECAGENGAGSDVIGSGLARYSAERETFTLRDGATAKIIALIGATALRLHGAIN